MKAIDKAIKSEQELIDKLVELNKRPIENLRDAHRATWINVFIAQAYYFMAVLEKLKRRNERRYNNRLPLR